MSSGRGRSEHGAIGILAAAALLLAVVALAMGVDLGRIGWQRRELQQQADAAALAAARVIGSCVAAPVDPGATGQLVASANGFSGDLLAGDGSVEHGTVTSSGGLRRFTPGSDLSQSDAVRVTATRSVPLSRVLPTRIGGQVPLRAEAVARTAATGALRVGSFVADFDSRRAAMLDALLSAYLGSAVTLTAISYEGLAEVTVSVEELALAAGVDEQTLLSQTTTLAGLLATISGALTAQGEGSAATSVDQLEAATSTSRDLQLEDLIVHELDLERLAFAARIRVLDLILLAAAVAWEDQTLAVGPVDISVPGAASISLELRVVEPPQIAIGRAGLDDSGQWRTLARTAAVRVQIEVDAANALTLVGSDPVQLALTLTVGQGEGALRSVECARAATPLTSVEMDATPGTASVALGSFVDIDSDPTVVPVQVAQLTVLGSSVADVSVSASATLQDAPDTLSFDSPFVPELTSPSGENSRTVGSDVGTSAATTLTSLSVSPGISVSVVGALPVGVTPALISSEIDAILGPVLADLDLLLTPLVESLGVHLGGLDVTVLSVNRAQPALLL